MTDFQKQHGPFAKACPASWGLKLDCLHTCDAASRIDLVKESADAEWLQAVIKDRDVQSSVRLAAERRLRWLHKNIKALHLSFQS